MDTPKIDVTDLLSDLKHEAEKYEVLLDSKSRYITYQRKKINAIPDWILWVFRKTIWKNIKIN